MKKISLTALGIFIGLTFCIVYFSYFQASSAQKIAGNQWEYSSISAVYAFNPDRDKLNKIYGMTEICYLQPTGCRRAEIKHEIDYGTYLQERGLSENYDSRRQASFKASEIAFQKALSQLGNEGWEIVSDPNLNFEFISIDLYNRFEDKSHLLIRENTKAVYFKRLKVR